MRMCGAVAALVDDINKSEHLQTIVLSGNTFAYEAVSPIAAALATKTEIKVVLLQCGLCSFTPIEIMFGTRPPFSATCSHAVSRLMCIRHWCASIATSTV
jgi:hypothetical protein